MRVKEERTNERASEYSHYHRMLGAEYLAVDVDYVEYRIGRGIVAFLATTGRCESKAHLFNCKKHIWNRSIVEREVLFRLSVATGAPAYFVIHTTDLSLFHVHNLREPLNKYIELDKEQYSQFIKEL